MELGSLVCAPVAPRCGECPVAAHCVAFELGLQDKIPAVAKPQAVTVVREAAVIVRKNGAVLMRQCGADERWAGLWDFPRFAVEAEGPLFVRDELAAKVAAQTGLAVAPGGLLNTLRHGVTRFRITLDCYEATVVGGRVRSTAVRPVKWQRLAEIDALPLSTTGRKLARLLHASG
jgi:A/G-specific adenine glycosylase